MPSRPSHLQGSCNHHHRCLPCSPRVPGGCSPASSQVLVPPGCFLPFFCPFYLSVVPFRGRRWLSLSLVSAALEQSFLGRLQKPPGQPALGGLGPEGPRAPFPTSATLGFCDQAAGIKAKVLGTIPVGNHLAFKQGGCWRLEGAEPFPGPAWGLAPRLPGGTPEGLNKPLSGAWQWETASARQAGGEAFPGNSTRLGRRLLPRGPCRQRGKALACCADGH